MDLLPGIPYDVAMECLIRLPFDTLASATSVSKGWKAEIELPEFRHHRSSAGVSQSVIVVSQAWVDPTRTIYTSYLISPSFYRLAVLHPETQKWSDLPPVPEFPHGLPILCHLAGVGSELVVIGGCDPVDWRVFDCVFVYSFLTNKWRRGAHMPGDQRFFFGCTTDGDRTVYVAGGHDQDKKALKSVLAYDVAENKWAQLPDMAKGRDECKGLFYHGRLHVIGGYSTEMQGRFSRDSEKFDVATWQWGPVDDEFLEDVTCPRTCAEGVDGRVYECRKGYVMVREAATWQVLVGLPDEMRHVDFVAAWLGKLLVIGFCEFGGPHRVYVLSLKDYTWEQIEAPEEVLRSCASRMLFRNLILLKEISHYNGANFLMLDSSSFHHVVRCTN